MAHVQFEIIHPFLDGNGPMSRLLIAFLFCAEGAFREPLLYLSPKHLAKLGIARETTGRNYGRIYAYDKYLKILNEGTEPLN